MMRLLVIRNIIGATGLLSAAAALAQDERIVGHVAPSTVGRAGQRQTPEEAASFSKTMGRIDSRIASRVQSRVQNRIDRDYNSQSSASSSIEAAEGSIRQDGASRPR